MSPEYSSPIDGFSTHLPMLGAVLAMTYGPVLELGSGHYSTPFLHAYCGLKRRELVTVEFDPGWVEKFAPLAGGMHTFVTLKPDQPLPNSIWEKHFQVVLVDQEPVGRRFPDLQALVHSDIFVMHDSQDPVHRYDELVWRRAYEYKLASPWTRLGSNTDGGGLIIELIRRLYDKP